MARVGAALHHTRSVINEEPSKFPPTQHSTPHAPFSRRNSQGVTILRPNSMEDSYSKSPHSQKSAPSRPHSRRNSRLEKVISGDGRSEVTVTIDDPAKESLYPSLTTLGSLDSEEEEDFSCRECCKSTCSHIFNFTVASCLYVICQRKKVRQRLDSSTAIEDIEMNDMKTSLQFHFMNPFQKWRFAKRRRFPWKLFAQLINIVLVTLQLILFATTKLPLTHFIENNHKTLVHLFIENPIAPTAYQAIPSPIGNLYTLDQLYSQLNFTTVKYYTLEYEVLGPYGYQWQNQDFPEVYHLTLYLNRYSNGTIDPENRAYNFSDDLHWEKHDLSSNLSASFMSPEELRSILDSIREMKMHFALSSIYVSEHTRPQCFQFWISLVIKNDITMGSMPVYMYLKTEQSSCRDKDGNGLDVDGGVYYSSIGLTILDVFVIVFATISTILYVRSLVKSAYFARVVRAFFMNKFNYRLHWKHLSPLFNMWFVGVILGNTLATLGGLLKILLLRKSLNQMTMVDMTSIVIGLAVFAQWCGILRFLSYFDKYNMLLLTLRLSMPSVIRFFVCAGILYFAFLFCGWLVLGAYHPKFKDLSTTSENLFALLNGDDIYNTYQEMSHMSTAALVFSKVYLYLFISLFIYVVLSVFISLISDTYETLHEHWSIRSKGLLVDFAYSQLGRVRHARARAYSGGSSQEEENDDYDMIREIAETTPTYGSTDENQPLLPNRELNINFTGSPTMLRPHASAEFTIGEREKENRTRSCSST